MNPLESIKNKTKKHLYLTDLQVPSINTMMTALFPAWPEKRNCSYSRFPFSKQVVGLRKTKTNLSLTIAVNRTSDEATGNRGKNHPSLFQLWTNLSHPPIKALLQPIFSPSSLFCINIACLSSHLGAAGSCFEFPFPLIIIIFYFSSQGANEYLKWREVLFYLKLSPPPPPHAA